jgi:hypothetical protein
MGGGMGRMTGLGFEAEKCDNRAVFSTGEITQRAYSAPFGDR